jgi:hypothetical protein
MKPYRAPLLASAILLATLPLSGCDNPLEGGSSPSGSYIRVVSVEPRTLEPNIAENLNSFTTVTMKNESAPNTLDNPNTEWIEDHTNSYVTMSRYRVDFTGLNMTVSIPSIDGGGQTVGIPPDQSGSMEVLVMDAATLEYIRSHYPTVGSGGSLTLRATITIWGEDSFKVTVQTVAQVTLVVSDTTPVVNPIAPAVQ